MSDQPIARCEHQDGRHFVESASAVVADASGRIVATFGDPRRTVRMRSTLKPLRTVALLRQRVIDPGDAEAIALASGSHTGSAAHVTALEAFASRYKVELGELRCSRRAPLDSGHTDRSWSRLENECSGEHIGALVLARHLGVASSTYLDAEGAVQRSYSDTLVDALSDARMTERLDGRDGCGMPSFRATLAEIATAYARLASHSWFADVGALVSKAIRQDPLLFSGERQFVYGLIRHSEGLVLGKGGADGLYAAWWPARQVGAAASATTGFHGAAALALRWTAQRADLPFPDETPYYLDDTRVMSFELLA